MLRDERLLLFALTVVLVLAIAAGTGIEIHQLFHHIERALRP